MLWLLMFLPCDEWAITADPSGSPWALWELPEKEVQDNDNQATVDAAADPLSRFGIVKFTAEWCGPCKAQEGELSKLPGEIYIRRIDIDDNKTLARREKVGSIPDIRLIWKDDSGVWRKVFDGTIRQRWVGVTSAETILREIKKRATGKSRPVREKQSPRPAGNARQEPDTVHIPPPVKRTPWGTYDLRTWRRICNSSRCTMCNTIDALQREYFAAKTKSERQALQKRAWQAPSDAESRRQAIDLAALLPSDVFCDIGCGDGRVLIEAVQRSGCTAVGVEIDAELAERARDAISDAGLANRIRVITGDATDPEQFSPDAEGVTVAFMYLFPSLIEKMMPRLENVQRIVSIGHDLPGSDDKKVGNVFVLARPRVQESPDGQRWQLSQISRASQMSGSYRLIH